MATEDADEPGVIGRGVVSGTVSSASGVRGARRELRARGFMRRRDFWWPPLYARQSVLFLRWRLAQQSSVSAGGRTLLLPAGRPLWWRRWALASLRRHAGTGEPVWDDEMRTWAVELELPDR